MTKTALTILLSLGLAAGLTACGKPTPAQQEKAEFDAKCQANPKLRECVDYRCTQTGVCDMVPDAPASNPK